ncbi:hypothetical protein ACFSKW_06070 [Nonomuraea mangrovi]|uniref:Uncharacterized protein n=1 Tax=Nonomuraea mangrovi TaxID=2316207 RepID=A0ABW4SN97_9ACTN
MRWEVVRFEVAVAEVALFDAAAEVVARFGPAVLPEVVVLVPASLSEAPAPLLLLDAVLREAVLLEAVLPDAVLSDVALLEAVLLEAVLLDPVLRDAVLLDPVPRDAALLDVVVLDAVALRGAAVEAVAVRFPSPAAVDPRALRADAPPSSSRPRCAIIDPTPMAAATGHSSTPTAASTPSAP